MTTAPEWHPHASRLFAMSMHRTPPCVTGTILLHFPLRLLASDELNMLERFMYSSFHPTFSDSLLDL